MLPQKRQPAAILRNAGDCCLVVFGFGGVLCLPAGGGMDVFVPLLTAVGAPFADHDGVYFVLHM